MPSLTEARDRLLPLLHSTKNRNFQSLGVDIEVNARMDTLRVTSWKEGGLSWGFYLTKQEIESETYMGIFRVSLDMLLRVVAEGYNGKEILEVR